MKATIVGAGLAGAVASVILRQKGFEVTAFETRPHIGGNCYDSKLKGITIHNYGPHGFHTKESWVWDFVNKFEKFNSFKLKVNSRLQDGRIINIPYNLETEKLVGVWDSDRITKELFVPYSEKHWGCKWEELPVSITSRVPKKREDSFPYYHLDQFQGVPINGYTSLIESMFEGSKVILGCESTDWKKHKSDLIVYTGSIDSYFDYCFGFLTYRSLKFEFLESLKTEYHQLNECNTINRWTRAVDHSHWHNQKLEKTIISREYSEEFNFEDKMTDRFYPKSFESQYLYNQYKEIPTKTIFLGRLGTYKYLDMDDCIKQVFSKLKSV